MKKLLLTIATTTILLGCQATGNVSNYDASSVEGELVSYDKFSKKFFSYEGFCTKNNAEAKSNGKYIYFNEKYNKGGDLKTCYDVLASKISHKWNGEFSEEQVKRLLISQDFGSSETYKSMANDPKYKRNAASYKLRWDNYLANKAWIDNMMDDPIVSSTIWATETTQNKFEKTTKSTANIVKTWKGEKSKRYNFTVSCNTSADNKKLMLTWSHSDVFSAPNTTAKFIALINDEPVELHTKLYSNSYKSGFILPQKGFNQVINALIEGKHIPYRVSNDDLFESSVAAADDTTALKNLVGDCS
ncbi:hypothetical protein JK628_15520 [Shewanella sp. KX20019]|uniref:hypothetical protein n=1 Tax=Shewanella sp. KX20019 TaxID=2803864 RepID=UPI001928A275|nr:hypothetical protein [Shewanella sp. KX20019]QQX78963.1 hypothetical protein JK628_15520 [Shewanella sp. KX20019]